MEARALGQRLAGTCPRRAAEATVRAALGLQDPLFTLFVVFRKWEVKNRTKEGLLSTRGPGRWE